MNQAAIDLYHEYKWRGLRSPEAAAHTILDLGLPYLSDMPHWQPWDQFMRDLPLDGFVNLPERHPALHSRPT